MTSFAPRTVFYAIGDVHGLADRLKAMHVEILKHHEAYHSGRPAAIIHLGDYVDRGPHSRGVIDAIMALEAKARDEDFLTVLSLRGNHEQMLLDALTGDSSAMDLWLNNGGRDTLRSYKSRGQEADEVMYQFPLAHRAWLESLPNIIHDEDRKLVFVHAGVDPATFPNCEPQIYIWTRSPRFTNPTKWRDYPAMEGYRIVHGHTPTLNGHPEIAGAYTRINVDTGAVFGGPLTAAVLSEDLPLGFLRVPATA
jgi:serine/threonine protein phosphatase 1